MSGVIRDLGAIAKIRRSPILARFHIFSIFPTERELILCICNSCLEITPCIFGQLSFSLPLDGSRG